MRNKKLVVTVSTVVLVAGLVIGAIVISRNNSTSVNNTDTEVSTEVVALTDEEKADFEDLKKKTIEEIEALNKDSNEEVNTVVTEFVEKLNGIKVDDFTVYADLEKEVASVKTEAQTAVNNKVAELAAKAEEERLAAEEAARVEAERLAAEEAARVEEERLAAEEAANSNTSSSSSSKKNSSSKGNGSSNSSSASNASSSSSNNNYVSDDDRLETAEEQMKRAEEAKKRQEEIDAAKASGADDGVSWVPKPAYDEEKAQQATNDILNDIPVVGE